VITDSAGVVRYVLSGTWDSKMEGAHVLNGDDASTGRVDYITGQSKVLWQRRYPPYDTLLTYLLVVRRFVIVNLTLLHSPALCYLTPSYICLHFIEHYFRFFR